LVEGAIKAIDLLEKGQAAEALEILLELDRTYPNHPEVLGTMVNAYYDLHDFLHYEYAMRRLARLEGHHPELSFALAGTYMANGRPAMALHAFQEALRRWPDDAKAEQARKDILMIDNVLHEQAAQFNLEETRAYDLLLQHDELRYCLDHGEYRQGRQVAEKLLRSFPDFVPALNNLSQIQSIEGDFEPAVQTILRALQVDPDNIHALSNLARLYFLGGRPDEAHKLAQRLKSSQAFAADRWTKIAEALTFLEDDAGVLALYEPAKAAGELEPPHVDALFYHLLAVAAYRLGKEKDAQKHWQKALKIDPHFAWALENVADLKKPVDDRSGVWAFALENWLLAPAVNDLYAQLETMKHAAKKSDVQARLGRFIEEKHAEVLFLAPHLVERGDAKAREFIVRTAAVTGHPILVSAAKDFVFGKRGSSQERFQAANILSEADLMPSGPIQMWSGDEKHEVMLLNVEINSEPVASNLPARVLALLEKAISALHDNDGPAAQAYLEQALVIRPDDPGLINNLAMSLEMQDQFEKAHDMVRQLHSRFPDYFFGVVGVAVLAIEEHDLDRAHHLLDDLMQRKKMHTSEFIALCRAQIQICLADKKPEAARTWLDMWARVDPDDQNMKNYRRRIGLMGKS